MIGDPDSGRRDPGPHRSQRLPDRAERGLAAQTQTRSRAKMTDTRRPAPAGAGRRVQPRLDKSLTGSASHEMSTSDLSAAMPGRHQIGMVAGFGLECWPTSRRNSGRLPVGISGRLRRNTHPLLNRSLPRCSADGNEAADAVVKERRSSAPADPNAHPRRHAA